MAKKRRVTVEQARLLAIWLIQKAVDREQEEFLNVLGAEEIGKLIYDTVLPEQWQDGQTSERSWNLLWLEVTLQLTTILKGLDKEAVRIRLENPDFRYNVQYPLSNGVAK